MRSFRLIGHSCRLFWKQPALLLPLFLVWLIYAPGIIYLRYFFPWENYDAVGCLQVAFLFITALTVAIAGSCTWLLEMLKQGERGEKLNLFTAFYKAVFRDFLSVFPIALVWAVIWFVLSVIDAMLSKQKRGEEKLTAESAAQTLAGFDNLSLSGAVIQALQKGIRMTVFLILPAIVWEGLGPRAAVKKGLGVLRAHLKEFAFGYALTYAAAVLIFLPAAIFLELARSKNGHALVHFPQQAWMGLIIYIGFAWSFCFYLEQMFGASLYLWHLKWEQASVEAIKRGEELPLFKNVPPPQLLQTFAELQTLMPIFGMPDAHGRTLLHIAAYKGDLIVAEELLSKGADPNARDSAGNTPLDYALRNKQLDLIKLLISCGAIDNANENRAPAADSPVDPTDTEEVDLDLAAAENGLGDAMLRVAHRYKTGTFYAQDLARYLAWTRKAAEAGDPAAMEELGSMYERGENVARDPAAAAQWYLAANTNLSLMGLIRLYRDGKGPAAEARQVFAAFLHAITKNFNDPVGTYGLAIMYQTGQGAPMDTKDAEHCFQRAAELGFVDCA